MAAERAAEPEWQRQRRLAAVFGEVLPDATADDLPESTPEATESTEEWLRAQVPPHHG